MSDSETKDYLDSLQATLKAQESDTNTLIHSVKILGIIAGAGVLIMAYGLVTQKLYS